jgi:alpha-galactosidase
MKEVTISLIGAGSLVFTSALIKTICETDLVKDAHVGLSLMDRDGEKLKTMQGVARMIIEHYGKKRSGVAIDVCTTTDRPTSFEGADFAVQTMSVGGVYAARVDGELPKKFGIRQTIGDSVGPGGVMRGLRQIPAAIEIATDLHDHAPGCTLINFSNPMTPLLRSLYKETKVKVFGMCTSILGFVMDTAKLFGVPTDEVMAVEAGVNHYTWTTGLEVRGEDKLPQFQEWSRTKPGRPPFEEYSLSWDLYRLYGLLPVPGDRHIAEFMPGLLADEAERKKYDIPVFPERTIYSEARRKPITDAIGRVVEGALPVGEFLSTHFMEDESVESVKVLEAIALDRKRYVAGVNVPNRGYLAGVPDWAVVEVPANVDGKGVHPVGGLGLPSALMGTVAARSYCYESLVEAALARDRDGAVRTMLLDGYVGSQSEAERLTDAMIEGEREWLPEGW